MARSNYVAKARKSPGNCGTCSKVIEAGDPYIWWKFRYGGKHIRCTEHPPRQSDMISSDKLSRAYAASEGIEDDVRALRSAVGPVQTSLTTALEHDDAEVTGVAELFEAYEGAKGTLENASSEAQDIASEYNESADNIEQAFSTSSTADECRERADALEEWSGSIDSVDTDLGEFWSAFDPFFEQAREQSWLPEDFCKTADKAFDDAERGATQEAWQEAFNLLVLAFRQVRADEEAVALFRQAVDSAFDALDTVAENIEGVVGELSI